MGKLNLFIAVIFLSILVACNKDEDDSGSKPLSGTISPMGEVYNNFIISSIPGVESTNAIVLEVNGDVSTIEYTAEITDELLLDLVKAMPDVSIDGNKCSVKRDYRITSNGFQSVYAEGNLTIVNYDAKVGDTYRLKRGNRTISREVTNVSKSDDYNWGGMLIKTINVEETGRNLPGVSKIEFIANHRWGMVGILIQFEDGSSKTIDIASVYTNH